MKKYQVKPELEQIANILVENKYCTKCLSILGEKRVKDYKGNEYCDETCRRENFTELNQDQDDLYGEYIGRD